MANQRKLRELALIAPLLGALLLMPPMTWLFSRQVHIFGIPLLALYILCVWVGLIVVAMVLAAKLKNSE